MRHRYRGSTSLKARTVDSSLPSLHSSALCLNRGIWCCRKERRRSRQAEVTAPRVHQTLTPNVSYLKLSGVRNVGGDLLSPSGLRCKIYVSKCVRVSLWFVECCNFESLRSSSQMWRECDKIYINMVQEVSDPPILDRGFHGVRSSSLLDASFAPRIISSFNMAN